MRASSNESIESLKDVSASVSSQNERIKNNEKKVSDGLAKISRAIGHKGK